MLRLYIGIALSGLVSLGFGLLERTTATRLRLPSFSVNNDDGLAYDGNSGCTYCVVSAMI